MSKLNIERYNYLITKYFIPNMGHYSSIDGELPPILDRLDANGSLSPDDKQWIRDKGLFDLNNFIKNLELTGQSDFKILKTKITKTYQKNLRQELWENFDINYIDSCDMRQMVKVLENLNKGNRLKEKDVIWLTDKNYFSTYPKIKQVFHNNEALFYHQSFNKTKDLWQVVNASSHYRKANHSNQALDILNSIEITSQKNKHLKAALCTTKGGCKRDLRQFTEATQLAEIAHSYDPASFHPCTLLGAIYYEIGNYNLGHEWFIKAEERGATTEKLDYELYYIFNNADKAKKEELKNHLLHIDPVRYAWVNKKKKHNRGIN